MEETLNLTTSATRAAWYEVAGPAEAKPIVLVHGSTVTRKSWQPQIDALSGEYRLIAVDLPGHGALAGEPFHFESAVETLRQAVDQEAGGCALLVGMSLGGYVATLFAQRYPEKVAGLVISGASMNFQGMVGLWMRLVGTLMLRFMREDRLVKGLEKSIRQKWPDYAEEQIAAGLYPYGAAQAFQEGHRYDFRLALSGVKSPVLILNGELDKSNRKSEAAFAAAAANARVEIIPGAGHACSIEQPEAFTEHLRRFAKQINWLPVAAAVVLGM